MEKVVSVKVIEDYRMEVEFNDGLRGIFSMKGDLWGPMFEPLKDPEYFAKAFVDESGAVAWPNGADLCPVTLYEEIRASIESRV